MTATDVGRFVGGVWQPADPDQVRRLLAEREDVVARRNDADERIHEIDIELSALGAERINT